MQDRALEIVETLIEARCTYAQATLALADHEYTLVVDKADAEARTITDRGGEKELGPNAEARTRTLIQALDGDTLYQDSRANHRSAMLAKLEAQADVKALEEELKVILAFAGEG